MRRIWLVGGLLALVVALMLMNLASSYNHLVTLSENIDGQWAQVENQLQRRYDLIPNLVETVKGYAAHEKSAIQAVADARARLAGARSPEARVAAANQVEGALSRLLVVVEAYPDLKASANFQRLMDELSGTENRISVERMRYNEMVLAYNRTVKGLPMRFFARSFGFEPRAYFEPEKRAKETPQVKF